MGRNANIVALHKTKETRFYAHPEDWYKKEHEQMHEVIVEDHSLFLWPTSPPYVIRAPSDIQILVSV